MKITLIHALRHSVAPTEEAFGRLWPEARLSSVLDTTLSEDLARDGAITESMTERFLKLARDAAKDGADGILFTCSAFGPCIETCAEELSPMPVLKPNEAMIEDAIELVGPNGHLGLLATFAPTLRTMPKEFLALAPGLKLKLCVSLAALPALDAGDFRTHDEEAAESSKALLGCAAIALAQFSLARAASAVAEATSLPVLTTPDSAVGKMRRLLGADV